MPKEVDPYDHHMAIEALRRIAAGVPDARATAALALELIGDTSPAKPKPLPSHRVP